MSKRFRLIVILVVVVVSGIFVYPTVRWYFFVPEEQQELASISRVELREHSREQARAAIIELAEMVQEDPDATIPDEYSFLVEAARERYNLAGENLPSEWTLRTVLGAFSSENQAFSALEDHYREEILALKDLKSRIILLGLDLAGGMSVVLEADTQSLEERQDGSLTGAEVDDAVTLALEILRNRIDQFGVTEPQIRREDGGRISIELPGDNDRERVNSFLMGRGSLNFHIVDDEATDELLTLQTQNPGWSPDVDGVPEFIEAGTILSLYVVRDQYGIDEPVRYIAIREDIGEYGLDGSHIVEAQVARDPITNQPTVNFVLDNDGADLFQTLTRDNVGSSLAIVMDARTRAYAVINEEIPNGQVRMTGFDSDEASDIATVLRTAALPVDLEIVNQQAVGASLGEQAIRVGLRSILLGMALVVLFMIAYYKGAGFIADLALILNLFFTLSVLSVFNLTLTLTSIAGLILTVGMAVDANVIIFERIKEEYRLGKSPQAAVRAGFQKAFWTVMDANITTFIAAVFLSQLGTGPIQGFAITLAVGIVSSMFTALFVSRLIFDFGTEVLGAKKLSIAWRVSQ